MTLFIPKNLLRLAELCAPEGGRYTMSGVRVIDLQDGRYRLEATDGKRLAIVHGQSQAPKAGASDTFAALEAVANSGTEAIVSAADWKTALKMGSKRVDRVGLVINADAITLACGEQVLKARPVEGRWPDVGMVLPRTPPLVRFTISPGVLAGLLDVAEALQSEGVTLLYYGPGRPIGLMGKNGEGQFFDALLMPLS
jgi:hypothetical protein